VVELDSHAPFTAARARNVGFRKLQQIAPHVEYIQFVDGDCELDQSWPNIARSFLAVHQDVAAVCGRLRERNPDKTIYNWLCDVEWNQPVGEVRAFSGNVTIRVSALKSVGGYRDGVIAAEEDELCVRLRAAGWRIWRLSQEMALHDADMTSFAQWWRRSKRCGYAYAVGSFLHGASGERHFVWESRRALTWGVWLPLACLLATFLIWPWGTLTWLVYPL
jgi:GT2 family glycosyltransferase